MARDFLTNINLNLNELQNAKLQILASDPGSPVEGQFWYNSTTKTLKFRTNSATIVLGRLDQVSSPTAAVNFNGQQITSVLVELLASDPGSPADGRIWVNTTSNTLKFRANSVTYNLGRLDQLNAPTADVSLNGQKITNLADGTSASDAATYGQVQAAQTGLDTKQSVRAASTANVDISSAPASIDGVTLTSGDRVLLKNQTSGDENGIYVFTAAASALTRATDADTDAEVNSGMYMWVEEGTANSDTGWILTTNNPITLDTTSLTFTKFAAAPIPTGVSKYSASIGNGSNTSFSVTHNLGTTDVIVQVFDNSSGAQVEADVTHTSTTVATVAFTVAPTTNQFRVVVIG